MEAAEAPNNTTQNNQPKPPTPTIQVNPQEWIHKKIAALEVYKKERMTLIVAAMGFVGMLVTTALNQYAIIAIALFCLPLLILSFFTIRDMNRLNEKYNLGKRRIGEKIDAQETAK